MRQWGHERVVAQLVLYCERKNPDTIEVLLNMVVSSTVGGQRGSFLTCAKLSQRAIQHAQLDSVKSFDIHCF